MYNWNVNISCMCTDKVELLVLRKLILSVTDLANWSFERIVPVENKLCDINKGTGHIAKKTSNLNFIAGIGKSKFGKQG